MNFAMLYIMQAVVGLMFVGIIFSLEGLSKMFEDGFTPESMVEWAEEMADEALRRWMLRGASSASAR